jgi:hypothetical protein
MATTTVSRDNTNGGAAPPCWPVTLRVDTMAAMLNCELPEHPIYDSVELQWFDDDVHGTGMLAFLCRRADRRVDYYPQPGLRLDRSGYQIAGGTGAWVETTFEAARLEVTDDGVAADACFTDIDGRRIEIRVNDRDGRPRRRGRLLAPVSAATEQPEVLLLVWLPGFDLVRATGNHPVVRIDGEDATIGRIPGGRIHRRHLVKYTAPLCTVEVNPEHDGPLPIAGDGFTVETTRDETALEALLANHAGHQARLTLDPPMPDLMALDDGDVATGRWHVGIDEQRLTGGTWTLARTGDVVSVGMDADESWRPRRLPLLMRIVTTIVPVFRRWPTTYRWRGSVELGPPARMTTRWERTSFDRGEAYIHATRPPSTDATR